MTNDVSISRLVDELAIRNLVARLSFLPHTDTDEEMDDYISIYTPDGAWAPVVPGASEDSRTLERRGREEVLAGVKERRAAKLQGPGSHSKHFVTTILVAFESDEVAVCRSNFLVFNEINARPPVVYSGGEYRDRFVRRPEGWQLARREIIAG
jgi:SnoaL-like domain